NAPSTTKATKGTKKKSAFLRVLRDLRGEYRLWDLLPQISVMRQILQVRGIPLRAIRRLFDLVVLHQLQVARPLLPRLGEHNRIFDGHVVVQRVALAPQPLDHVRLVAVKETVVGQPGGLVEIGDVNDERLTLPASDGVPVRRRLDVGAMLCVHANDTE